METPVDEPSKEALEAAREIDDWYFKDESATVRGLARRIEAYAAARVAEAMKPAGGDYTEAVLGTTNGVCTSENIPLPCVIGEPERCECWRVLQMVNRVVAEARAQERERIASIFDDASKDAAALYILEGFPEDLKEQRAWERIAARIRALAEPSE